MMFSTVRVTKLVKRAQPEVMEIDVLHSHDTRHNTRFNFTRIVVCQANAECSTCTAGAGRRPP